MKFSNPFDMAGEVKVEALYKLGSKASKLSLDNSGDASENVNLDWDSIKTVEIGVVISYKLFAIKSGMATGEGNFGFSAAWRVDFTDEGVVLELDGAQPKLKGKNHTDGSIVVSASPRMAQSSSRDKNPYVEVVVALAGGTEEQGLQLGVQAGPVSVSGGGGPSRSGGSEECDIRLNFKVLNRPVPVVAAPIKIPPSLLAPAPLLFKEDEDTLSSESARELHAWVDKVKDFEELSLVVSIGDVPLRIQAFASTTGTEKYNKGETDRRLESVKKVLKSSQYFSSNALKFEALSHGLTKADGKGAKNAFNRRVEIKIDQFKAIQAIQKRRGK